MKEPWEEKVKRVRESSPYSHLPNWRILTKNNDVKYIYIYFSLRTKFREWCVCGCFLDVPAGLQVCWLPLSSGVMT